jgi:hypothetical protein
MPAKLFDTFVKCPQCGLLVWVGQMPEMVGAMITGNHKPEECEGVALPSETPICWGGEMFGRIKQ